MSGLFDGTPLQRPVTCEVCEKPLDDCTCPRDGDGNVKQPQDQRVRVRREKRRKGKIVTVVAGLDPAASDLPTILRTLKSACAAGGTVTEDSIEVQGDHIDRVRDVLTQLGYPVST